MSVSRVQATQHALGKHLQELGIDIDPFLFDDVVRSLDSRFSGPQAAIYEMALTVIHSYATPENGVVVIDGAPTVTMVMDVSALAPLTSAFESLKPWRKGPFRIGDLHIDAEWDCRLKWDRIRPHLPDLTDKWICDIGCNSGYFLFRMAKHRPTFVLGIDPSSMYFYQFHALQHFFKDSRCGFSPIGFNDLAVVKTPFDIIFSMGILYHHPDPLGQLRYLHQRLSRNGMLVLETLFFDSPHDTALIPEKRYARMKHISIVPSESYLRRLLNDAGFKEIDVVSTSTTTAIEQRVTEWSSQASLSDFLDPNDSTKTIEGYPAPKRLIVLARK